MSRSLRRLLKGRATLISVSIILCFALGAVLAPIIAPYDPTQVAVGPRLSPPSAEHWFGTDDLGRDLFSRVLYGGRLSLVIGFSSVLIALVLGVLMGLTAGYFKRTEPYIMGLVEILMAFPAMLRAIAIVAILGTGLINTILAIGIGSIPVFARLTRSSVLVEKEREYVLSARAVGVPEVKILFRHVLPNVVSTLIVYSSLTLAQAILTSASLSFLGLGTPPPAPEWGSMIHAGQQFLRTAPHVVLIPSAVLLLVVLAFNMLGDELRDALDPRLQV